ncbi:GCC2 and GCC3, partial [Teladorsagia circumcincta]
MFTDNVGVVSVKSNYRSGQSFTWGYYRVVYVANDAAGNSAVCSFSVVVSASDCKAPEADEQLQGELIVEPVNGTDSLMSAHVSCNDEFYPRNDLDFYVCDVMIRQQLRDWLLKDLWPYCSDQNCTGELWIDSDCPSSAAPRSKRSIRDAFYGFNFYVNVNSTRTLLKDTIGGTLQNQFPNASLSISDSVVCDKKFPLLSTTNGNASCADCPPGQYYNNSSGICASCPVDTYRTRDDPLEQCSPCPKETPTTGERTGQKDPSACHKLCDAGAYYDDSTKDCQLCPFGTYQEKRGGAACMPCPSDTSTSMT